MSSFSYTGRVLCFWWGCRENLTLITFGSERVKIGLNCAIWVRDWNSAQLQGSFFKNLSIFTHSNNVWAMCPKGTYLQGLYKSEGKFLGNIETGKCCQPEGHDNHWGDCYDEDVSESFDKKGWSNCKDGYHMAGFYRGGCDKLYCIEKFKCCKMLRGGESSPPSPPPSPSPSPSTIPKSKSNGILGFTQIPANKIRP